MENNCFVKNYKGIVNDDSLPIFNQLVLTVSAGTSYIGVKADEESACEVSGGDGVTFKNNSLTNTYTNPFTLTEDFNGFAVVATKQAKVKINNKTSFKKNNNNGIGFNGIQDIEGGLSSLFIPEDVVAIQLVGSTMRLNPVDIVNLVKDLESLTKIEFKNNVNGDISAFAALTHIQNIDLSTNTSLSGNISSVGGITTLANLALAGTSVSGTIESFVAAQRASGRTEGSVSGNSGGWGNVTFNGATTHAKGIVSWTASTITMDGVTINA